MPPFLYKIVEEKMDSFIFNLPTKIVFGKGEFSKLGEEAKKIGKKALLVTGKHFAKKSGLLEKAIKMLSDNGVEYVIFSEVGPNPESNTVDMGGKIAQENGVDFIIGIGGGSVIDASKGIAAVVVSGKPVWTYYERPPKEKVSYNALPILAVVTVAATGTEANPTAVITNSTTREKRGMGAYPLYPKVSIVDPLLTLSTPSAQTAEGVIDMFIHVLESYLSSRASAPISDRISEGLMKEAMKQGLLAFNDPSKIECRESLSWISTLALSGLPDAGRKGPFPIHALEHPISGIYPDISHGRGLAAIFPSYLYNTKDILSERLKLLGKELFSTDSPLKAIERIIHWMKNMDLYCSLKNLGVKREDLSRFADMAIADNGGKGIVYAREPLNKDTIMRIYETAFDYKDLFKKV